MPVVDDGLEQGGLGTCIPQGHNRKGDRKMDRGARSERTYARIYSVVKRIPKGRVATYGQVAHLAGLRGQARRVGYALSALRDDRGIPWHRVISAQGYVSPRSEPGFDMIQRVMLEGEGVRFDARDRVALQRFGWRPRLRPR